MTDSKSSWKLSLDEWRERLDTETFNVTRLGGTERPHTGAYCETFAPGTYHCICCDLPLFEAGTKFASGCGWPSFDAAVNGAITELDDHSFGMTRTEVRCARCDAHLGHVFPDGPTETGIRYCINSVSIRHHKE